MRRLKFNLKIKIAIVTSLFIASCGTTDTPDTFGGSDLPNFMTESMIEIPSSLTGGTNLGKTLISSDNYYLSRFDRVNNIMRLAETSRKALANYLERNKQTIEFIEALNADTTFRLNSGSNELNSYATIDLSEEYPKYEMVFININNELDTTSSISYIKTPIGYKGFVFYKLNIGNDKYSNYKIYFDDTNIEYKTTKIVGIYDSSYVELDKVVLKLKQEADVITLSGKICLSDTSMFRINRFSKDPESFMIKASVDMKQNIASLVLAVAGGNDIIDENIFENSPFVDKIMDNEFLDYDEQVFSNNLDQKKAAYVSSRDSILIDDIQMSMIEDIEDDFIFTIDMFFEYLYVNRENSILGLQELYDFSQIKQPIYLDKNSKFMFDKNEGLLKYQNLLPDTITMVE